MSEDNALLLFDLLSNISTLNQSRGSCFRIFFIFFFTYLSYFSLVLSSDLHLSIRVSV